MIRVDDENGLEARAAQQAQETGVDALGNRDRETRVDPHAS